MAENYTFRDFYIPNHMFESIQLYIQHGCKPGSFLSAIIKNDLKNAVMCADDINIANIPAYVGYFYSEAPAACWGYEGAIKYWTNYIRTKEKR